MATYIYFCEIHNEFEVDHSISEKLDFCPQCEKDSKKTKVKRLIGTTSFVLQGSGWAKDNYGK